MGGVADPAGRGGVRGRPSAGANVGVAFLELPLDAVAIDGVEKANPLDNFANRLPGARRDFGASIEQTFPHFKNVGFARSMLVTRRQTWLGPPTSFVFLGVTSCQPA